MVRPSTQDSTRSWPVVAMAGMFVFTLPGAALAHGGFAAHDFAAGFGHPLGGLDHVLAMFAVGLWAWRLGGRATWLVPAAFVAVMVVGAGLPLPSVEVGVAGSVLVLGVVVALDARPSLALVLPLLGVLALFHGASHGAEVTGVGQSLGFALATAALHGCGLACGALANRMPSARPVHAGGGAIALAGLAMLATV